MLRGMETGQLTQVPITVAPETVPPVDPLEVLRGVLKLERESKPTLDVEETVRFAVANPNDEIVGTHLAQ